MSTKSCFKLFALVILTKVTLMNISSRYDMKVEAASVSWGSFMPILAARDARVELRDKLQGHSHNFKCSSFAFSMHNSFSTCELENKKGSVFVDFNISELSYYSH